MKTALAIVAACFTLTANLYSQCTPNSATGTAGVTPAPDNVTCIEQGVPYDITMQLENFTTITSPLGNVTVNWARIDSLVNFPCGITWQANKLQFNGGETGCIRVSGTSTDAVGQYPLGIYMTLNVTALGQTLEQGGEVGGLINQLQNTLNVNLGIDISYYSRVKVTGTSCPAIDRSGSATNLNSSGATCQAQTLSATVAASASPICAGSSSTLTATVTNGSGSPTFAWSGGVGAGNPVTVSPTSTTAYTVTVTDGGNTTTASATVTVNSKPNAAFTASAAGNVVTLSSTTSGATSYAWNFGNSTNSALQSPPAQTYSANGTYTITLIATNNCGSDTATQTVTIIGVFVGAVEYDLNFDVYPNPSSGVVMLEFSAENSDASYEVRIMDLAGKTVWEEKYTSLSGSVQKQLDLNGFPKGTYALQLSSDKGIGLKKLVIR